MQLIANADALASALASAIAIALASANANVQMKLIATARRRSIANELVIVSIWRKPDSINFPFEVERRVNGVMALTHPCRDYAEAIAKSKEYIHLETYGEWCAEQNLKVAQRDAEGHSINAKIDDLKVTIQRLEMGATARVNLAHLLAPFRADLAKLEARREAMEAGQ